MPATRKASFRTLLLYHTCQRFCNPHELLQLPRILQRVKIPVPAMRKAFRTSKDAPRLSFFNDLDFQIALARQRGANFLRSSPSKSAPNMQRGAFFSRKPLSRHSVVQMLQGSTSTSAPTPSYFYDFEFQTGLSPQHGANIAKLNFNRQILMILTSKSLSRHSVVQTFRTSTSKNAPSLPVFVDFDFQIALVPQRDAIFVDILGSRSFTTPVFGS